MRRTSVVAAAVLCLGFTAAGPARAEPARWPGSGATARLGTAVGFSQLGAETVSTLGGQVAVGYRIGALTLEAEYDRLTMLEYMEDRGSNSYRGELSRYGVLARLYFITLARPGEVDPDSVLRLYSEAGLGRQRGRWSTGDEFARTDLAVGAGWLLEHRLRPRPGGLPFHSFGWLFGWQLHTSRTDRGDLVVERTTCKACGPPMPGAELDASLVVTCSFVASW